MPVTTDEIQPPQIRVTRNGIEATRVMKIEWADVDAYLEELTGTEFVAGNVVRRTNPVTFPGKSWLLLDGVDLVPFDNKNPGTNDSDGLATGPGGARVTINYKTLDFNLSGPGGDDPDIPDVPFLEHRVDLGEEMLTTPRGAIEWVRDGSGAGANKKTMSPDILIGTAIGIMTHQLSWQNVPLPPWAAIKSHNGKTNSTAFLGHPAEVVRFSGMTAGRKFSFQGNKLWTLDYRFNARIIQDEPEGGGTAGWNHSLRDDPKGAEKPWQLFQLTSGSKPFPTADLGDLFKAGTA